MKVVLTEISEVAVGSHEQISLSSFNWFGHTYPLFIWPSRSPQSTPQISKEMADAGFFKGTSADQDSRFKDKDAILRKSIKFPPEFDTKVDVKKVALAVIRPWVVKRLEEKLGLEDEILVEYVMTKLEENRFPDPKAMQIEITGFLRAK
ncbi:hypothetical protein FRB95_005229, partial [Tulasnella sp. JGI-2019a]